MAKKYIKYDKKGTKWCTQRQKCEFFFKYAFFWYEIFQFAQKISMRRLPPFACL